MKIISHRANLEGINKKLENKPEQIDKVLTLGYDVELDLWANLSNKKLFLGHDSPDHEISLNWLIERKNFIWIHCKNLDALNILTTDEKNLNYFWHQEDDYTLTSKNYIWCYPSKKCSKNSIMVMPEWNNSITMFQDLLNGEHVGICTDFPTIFKI